MFATFMEVLDTTVVNVSLPHIAGSLSATIDESTWALTSYLVANAIVLPMTGWLASFIGRKRLLMLAVSGFTISSLLCGLAPTLSSLISFRVLQGMTGGALQPLSQTVMLETFPPRERRHGDQPRVCRAVRNGPAPGGNGVVRVAVLDARSLVRPAHPARAVDESSTTAHSSRRAALVHVGQRLAAGGEGVVSRAAVPERQERIAG